MVSIQKIEKIPKMKIKSFECPKSIRNHEKKKYLEGQALGQRVVCPIGPENQYTGTEFRKIVSL